MTEFSYRSIKGGSILISWRGKTVVTLSGSKAARFLSDTDAASDEEAQLLMARATGNFKRGNERR